MSQALELMKTGNGSRRVLLLHPLGADHRFFDPLLPHLTDARVVRCDLPGHGRTGPDADDSVAQMSARVEEALRRDGDGPWVVVGVSLGGLIAQHLAADASDLVTGAVLVDTVATYPPPMRDQWIQRARDLAAGVTTVSDYLEATLQVWFDDDVPPEAVEYVRTALARTTRAGYAQACRALAGADTRAVAQRIHVPTLVACGTHDGQAFLDAVHWFSEHVPRVTIGWLPHKHGTVLQAPSAFAAVLGAFLNTCFSASREDASHD